MTICVETFGDVYLFARTPCQLSHSCNDYRVLKLSSRIDFVFVFYVRGDTYKKKHSVNKSIKKQYQKYI